MLADITIYSFPTFNLTKILLTAEELGIPYKLQLLDPRTEEHKSPEHFRRHPMGKVPAVEIDGQAYFESNNICRLFCELHGNRLYGDTPQQRATVNQWIDLMTLHVGRWLTVCFFEKCIRQLRGGEPSAAALAEAEGFLAEQLPVIEARLGEQAFFAAEQSITIADIIAYSYFTVLELTGIAIDSYPYLGRWLSHMQARNSMQRAMQQIPGGDMLAMFRS